MDKQGPKDTFVLQPGANKKFRKICVGTRGLCGVTIGHGVTVDSRIVQPAGVVAIAPQLGNRSPLIRRSRQVVVITTDDAGHVPPPAELVTGAMSRWGIR